MKQLFRRSPAKSFNVCEVRRTNGTYDAVKRIRRVIRPIPIKILRHLSDDRIDSHNIEIDKRRTFRRAQVFVADIATSDNRDLIICGEGLVVGPPVRVGCESSAAMK
jgi:hypothetical protein